MATKTIKKAEQTEGSNLFDIKVVTKQRLFMSESVCKPAFSPPHTFCVCVYTLCHAFISILMLGQGL